MKEITNKFYIVCAELRNNIWANIHTSDVLEAIKQEKNLYVVDMYQGKTASTYPLFEIDKYSTINPIDFPYTYLIYEQEQEFVLPQVIQFLLLKMHFNWVNEAFDYFNSTDFEEFYKSIQASEIPNYVDRWNAFVVNPYELRGMIISEFAYPNLYHAGIALGTFEKQKPISLVAIENTLKDSKPFGWNFQTDCINLMVQKILLLNKELVHGIYNEKFLNTILNIVNKQHLKAVLLLGEGLYPLKQSIECEAILFEEHPLPILKLKQQYKTDVFLKFEQLTNIQF